MLPTAKQSIEYQELAEKISQFPGMKIKIEQLFAKPNSTYLLNTFLKFMKTLKILKQSPEYLSLFHNEDLTDEKLVLSKLKFEQKYKIIREIFNKIFKSKHFSRFELFEPKISLYYKLFLKALNFGTKYEKLLKLLNQSKNMIEAKETAKYNIEIAINSEKVHQAQIIAQNLKVCGKDLELTQTIDDLEFNLNKIMQDRLKNNQDLVICNIATNYLERQIMENSEIKKDKKMEVVQLEGLIIPDHSELRQMLSERHNKIDGLRKFYREMEALNSKYSQIITRGKNTTDFLQKEHERILERNVQIKTKNGVEFYIANQNRLYEEKMKDFESLKVEFMTLKTMNDECQKKSNLVKIDREERLPKLKEEYHNIEQKAVISEIDLRKITTDNCELNLALKKIMNEIENEKITYENMILDFKNFSREAMEKKNEYKHAVISGFRG